MSAALIMETSSLAGETFSDDELTALALAADPDFELAQDAMCVWDVIGPTGESGDRAVLPEWYMPAPMAGARPRRRSWHRWVAVLVIASFLVIDALGLCITYGQLVVA
ncbi:MAG: hypothetical protein M3083_05260 [Actinomycetota bacterium]|nr:hypothetical protein [Actinomycetota bacterium]